MLLHSEASGLLDEAAEFVEAVSTFPANGDASGDEAGDAAGEVKYRRPWQKAGI